MREPLDCPQDNPEDSPEDTIRRPLPSINHNGPTCMAQALPLALLSAFSDFMS